MNKKLMAVAVAGALAAPALAFAQSSTVQVFGKITYEYGILDQGTAKRKTDYADSPGGSEIGFKGEEKLGGGMSAWFQCASSADVRGMDQEGWCTRNSALGFKGGFGNLYFGRWDTPMKRALNVGTVGAEETGILGMSFLPFGGSGGADATNSNDGPQRQRWKRREAGLSYYESPNFGGFQVLGAFSSGNAGADTNSLDGLSNAKPRVWSFAGIYGAGPLSIGLGYEKHKAFGGYAPLSAVDADDRAWGLSMAFTFRNNLKLGATFLDTKYQTNPGQDLKKRTATIGVDWNIAGPHGLEAQYAHAFDVKGNSTVGISGLGGSAAPIQGGVDVGDTDGKALSIAYTYSFSKRTRVKLGYIRVENGTNSSAYRVGNSAALVGPAGTSAGNGGQTVDGAAFHISHRF